MFTNIGSKIMALAVVLCWFGILASVVLGIVVLAKTELILVGILLMLIGPLLSWIGSFLLYGFGQLIDDADRIVDAIEPYEDSYEGND